MAHKPFVDPFPLSTAQAAADAKATAATVPAPATTTRKPIDPHTDPQHDWYTISYDEPEAIDGDFEATVDAIVLAGNDYAVLTRLQSGTLRTDRRSASPEEIEEMARDTRRRQQNRYDLMGSSQTGDETGPTSPFTKQEGKK